MSNKLIKYNDKFVTLDNKPLSVDFVGVDTKDGTATSDKIISGYTAYVNDNKITGSIPNVGSYQGDIYLKDFNHTIPEGYHDGTGKVSIAQTEQNKIKAENIKFGVNILGQEGNFTADGTAIASDILKDKIAYVNGEKIIGTHSDIEGVSEEDEKLIISGNTTADTIEVQDGKRVEIYNENTDVDVYSDTHISVYEGTVAMDVVSGEVIAGNLESENIKKGITILGKEGTYDNSIEGVDKVDDNAIEITQTFDYIDLYGRQDIYCYGEGTYYINNSEQELLQLYIDSNDMTYVTATNLSAENIREDVTVLGVKGTYNNAIQGVEIKNNSLFVNDVHANYIFINNNNSIGVSGSGDMSLYDGNRDIEIGENSVVNIYTVDNGEVTAPNLTAENIKDGVSILGVSGTYKGSILTDTGVIVLEKTRGSDVNFTLDTSAANVSMIVFTIDNWSDSIGEDPDSSTSYLEFTFSSNQFVNMSTKMFHTGYSIVMYKKNCFIFDDENNYIDRYEIYGDSLSDTEELIINLYSTDVNEESLYLTLTYNVYNFI